jgi:hypothetical protein
MQLSKSLLLLASLLVVSALVVSADPNDPKSEDYSDSMIEAIKVVYHDGESPLADFQKVEQAIHHMIEQLNKYEKEQGYLPSDLDEVRSDVQIVQKTCVLEASTCGLVFGSLQHLKRKYSVPEQGNLLVYLEGCTKRQEEFCSNPTKEVNKGAENVQGGAENVKGSAENVKAGAENVKGGAEDVKGGAENVKGGADEKHKKKKSSINWGRLIGKKAKKSTASDKAEME